MHAAAVREVERPGVGDRLVASRAQVRRDALAVLQGPLVGHIAPWPDAAPGTNGTIGTGNTRSVSL